MAKKTLKALKIGCSKTDCDNNLHCFRKSKRDTPDTIGKCRKCGVDLVDWSRLHKREIGDAEYTVKALKQEWVRHHFWHLEIDEKANRHARRKGWAGMGVAIENRIRKSVGPAEPSFDGRQTPSEGNSIFYAQHATACCCRKCMEYWHDIPMGVELTDEQIRYLSQLVTVFLKERMPHLKQEPEKIPSARRA